MKYRKSKFNNLLVSDVVKLTYCEMLLNHTTGSIINIFAQDVMQMTTKNWLILLPSILALFFMPIAILIEFKEARKIFQKDGALYYTTYNKYVIYWRDVSDFETKPYSWNEI